MMEIERVKSNCRSRKALLGAVPVPINLEEVRESFTAPRWNDRYYMFIALRTARKKRAKEVDDAKKVTEACKLRIEKAEILRLESTRPPAIPLPPPPIFLNERLVGLFQRIHTLACGAGSSDSDVDVQEIQGVQDEVLFYESSTKRTRTTENVGTGIFSFDDFSYRVERKLKKRPEYYSCRCIDRHCKGRAIINTTTKKGYIQHDHNHPRNYTDLEIRKFREKFEQEARQAATNPATSDRSVNRNVITELRSDLSDEAIANIPSSSSFTRFFQKRRQKIRSCLGDAEANIGDANLFEVPDRFRNFTTESTSEQFLIADINIADRGLRASVFMSSFGLRLLEKYRTIAFDGTFSIVPSHMLQLFTVHAFIDPTASLPVAYAIMSSKTTELYEMVFREIDGCLHHEKRPTRSMSDFERAAFTAAKNVWPAIDISLCSFHLGQSLHRFIQKEPTLLQRYANADDRASMRSLHSLTFVPVQHVYSYFCQLRTSQLKACRMYQSALGDQGLIQTVMFDQYLFPSPVREHTFYPWNGI
ncbi:hypothetical protein QR680_008294 [Steinernema hermaphroditum]|uniref:MULE transposase domain-containing protein n=1 Tax=Steinernema hermaphroditum TaxID=289476 RepID=A0AA39M6L9_9BILA|nr:hypothetical protein QR680_007572 [Steinernema hermaphroditum]KAK0423716.1 hypothetical protein QR680_008294 [Steinernema hermaphroditum]